MFFYKVCNFLGWFMRAGPYHQQCKEMTGRSYDVVSTICTSKTPWCHHHHIVCHYCVTHHYALLYTFYPRTTWSSAMGLYAALALRPAIIRTRRLHKNMSTNTLSSNLSSLRLIKFPHIFQSDSVLLLLLLLLPHCSLYIISSSQGSIIM